MTYLAKLFSGIFLLASMAVCGQITGNSSVTAGTVHTYTFNDGSTHTAQGASVWYTPGGTVQSESVSGTTYTANVLWGSGSSGTVSFMEYQNGPLGWGDYPIASLNVSISAPPPPAPPVPQIVGDQCGDAVITAPGSPPSGVEWYWITNFSNWLIGGDPGAVNASSDLTVTASGEVHLASRYANGGAWNYTTSWDYVVVHPPTVGGSLTSSTTLRCGTGAVSFSLSGHTGTILWWKSRYKNGSGVWTDWSTITETNTTSVNPTLNQWTGGDRTYEIQTAVQSGDCPVEYRSRQVVITGESIAGTISSNVSSRCGTGTISFSISGYRGGIQSWQYQYRDGSASWSGWTSITETDNVTTVNPNLPQWSGGQRTYRVRATVQNGVCSAVYPTKDVIVNPIPVAPTPSAPSAVCEGTNTTFTTTSSNDQWFTTASGGSPIHTGSTYNQVLNATTTLYVQAYNSYGCTNTTRVPVTVNVDSPSIGGTVNGSTEEFGMASGTLTLVSYTGNVVRWERQVTEGVSVHWETDPNSSTSPSLPYYNITGTTKFRAIVSNGTCGEVASSIAEVKILADVSVELVGPVKIRPGLTTSLVASSGHANYEWYRNNVSIQNSSSNTLIVSEPGLYKVLVTSTGGATHLTGNSTIFSQLDMDENAILSYTYRVPLTNVDNPFLYNIAEQMIEAQLFDGLGRPVQSIGLQVGPNEEDIITPIEYDEYGRQVKNYLPYADTSLVCIPRPNALNSTYSASDHYHYYQNISTHATDKAFAETRLEASPRSRQIEQGAAGAAWQLGQNTIGFDYAIADAAEVLRLSAETMLTGAKQFYGSGELYENTTTDEDGKQTVQYTNKLGQTVLKKSQVNATQWAETYYVYDINERLSVVIPPEATSRLDAEFFGQNESARKAFLNAWAFLYTYDIKNQMIMKKVPGADSVFMVYDKWNRLVLTQDGNQRRNSQWLFTKYDYLNRPIITGLMTGGDEAAERAAVLSENDRYESYSAIGINEYSDFTYPGDALVDNYLTVTYYDNYNWNTSGLAFTNPAGLAKTDAVKGQVTGTLTKVGNGTWIKSVNYYDDRYRVIQTQSTNHLGGVDVVTNHYDFIGQVTSSITTHDNGTDGTTITRSFAYDHAGRLLNTYHQLNDEPSILLSKNEYNELGELMEKGLHGVPGGTFVQSLDYTYNIRGWLRTINGPQLEGNSPVQEPEDLFSMELLYNTVLPGVGN